MNAADWIGFTMQASGGVLAFLGLHDAKRQHFPETGGVRLIASPKSGIRAAARSLRGNRAQSVVVGSASFALGGVAMYVKGVKTYNPPTTDDVRELREYVTLEIENLHKRVTDVDQDHQREMTRVRDEVTHIEAQLTQAIREVGDRIPVAIGGEAGRGLDHAAWGVLLAVFGLIVQTFAGT
jgi:ribosomal protein S18